MQCYDSLPAAVGMLAAAVAKNLSDNDVSLLAALFTQLGDSLALIVTARACENSGN